MIDYLRKQLNYREFTYFNQTCREKGWDHLQLPPTPWRRYIPKMLRAISNDAREGIALWIAPWLEPEDWQ